MPPGFTASLATRLDGASRKLTGARGRGRRGARPGSGSARPRRRAPAPRADGRAAAVRRRPEGGLRPRADLTIADAARLFGPRVLLVVLTGMGKDGLEGARAVKAAGGRVLVEAESTCTVYGMPRAVAEAGLADEVLPLDQLPAAIAREAGA